MHIKEFPKVTKNGEELVEKTDMHSVIGDFVEQMQERGLTSMSFFTDKFDEGELNEEEDVYEVPSGISYTQDFHHEDMMSIVLGYMNSCMDTKSKLVFATQLHNFILSEVIDGSNGDFDDDD